MKDRGRNKKLTGGLLVLVVFCVVLLLKDRITPQGTGAFGTEQTQDRDRMVELHNVWLVEAEEEVLTVLHDGEKHQYRLETPVQTPLADCIVDITLEKGKVTALAVKQDSIEAKVLRIGEDYVELEGYGCLALEDDSRVYRLYGEITEKTWNDVLVGYTTSSFVLADNKICAALIQRPVEVTGIRVLLQTSSYGGYYHETLECGSDGSFYLSDGSGKTEWLDGGEQVVITVELVEKYGGRIYLGTEAPDGKLSLYNVRRAIGVPSYRGTLEVAVRNGKLIVINELSMEEYLYGVLPSEMPDSFGMEALKAQAVCARSYACNQLLANRYCAYGAHVDDSMNCQVYQNYGETEGSVEAVKDTFGKVLTQDGTCITAYYFSCSYGHTSDSYDIWGENSGTRLEGVAQAEEGEVKALTTTKKFVKYLDSDREWYDEDSVWFRWNTIVGTELDERILERLQERQKAVPDMILCLAEETKEGMRFEQGEVTEFGTLEDIIIVERADSGVITKLLLVGSEASYLIQKEYNIRYVLAPLNAVYLKDGSTSNQMNLLPSAYFTVEKKENYFSIRGGGYGHGAGMSQYGAKYLASQGAEYEEILMHYYRNTELSCLYQD
ncbi:MAG: SpoIID/LytB domain-containing protein [Lachnospiraceae bacterium]|nr:SpoIID/LytB domain-containing protein [Lachnospiraceae bacterium]